MEATPIRFVSLVYLVVPLRLGASLALPATPAPQLLQARRSHHNPCVDVRLADP